MSRSFETGPEELGNAHVNEHDFMVEDNPDDAELAVRAFAKSKIDNDIILVRNGVEALDYLFATAPKRRGHLDCR